jgi:hypothetical protein
MKRALIVGRSAQALEDHAAALEFGPYDEVLVVGKMLQALPGEVHHAVSFHSDLFNKWAKAREQAGYPPITRFYWGATFRGALMYANANVPGPLKRVEQVGGSSGFLAVQIAINELECARVVLAGVPMTRDGSHLTSTLNTAENPGTPWGEADTYWETWAAHLPWLKEHVRSVSGRTRDTLGSPTKEWWG